jgi:hypothetical protein
LGHFGTIGWQWDMSLMAMGWSDPLLLLTCEFWTPSRIWVLDIEFSSLPPCRFGTRSWLQLLLSHFKDVQTADLYSSVHLSLWHNSWAEEFLEKECIRTERRTLQRRCLCWMLSFQASKFMVKTLRQPKKGFFLNFFLQSAGLGTFLLLSGQPKILKQPHWSLHSICTQPFVQALSVARAC